VAAGEIEGLDAQRDYHRPPNERLNEAISRSWNRLQAVWASFHDALRKLPEGASATSETRERWLLVLFEELSFGRLQPARGVVVGGRNYPISHLWGSVPIHLVGAGVSLDRRTPGQIGAARTSPHGLVQDLLSASDDYRWGIVSNGLLMRVLRDNVAMTRQAFLEFDLEEIIDGQVYSDFVLLWLVIHQSRFEGKPAECWLERWSKDAQQAGVRALDHLREGVERAIGLLGGGFLLHPANGFLRERLRSGELDTQEYYRQLLRVVYRLIFLFVAEDRELLLLPGAPAPTKEIYRRYYSADRLRRLADLRRGATQHVDLWEGLWLVMRALGSEDGCPGLGLPALGSFLWSNQATDAFAGCKLANRDLLRAVAALGFVADGKVRRQVDYRNLGPEELGSVYESLLERHPRINLETGVFELATLSGNERKTTGSYYTPTSLISCLLDSALGPVLDEAAQQRDPERAILGLRVVDPACGSGHFLIAAAHRIARRLAAVRSGDEEPSPDQVRHALRDVIGNCVYGVDVNPMAVELCKVSFWIEALDPGRPLSFLDQHIQCGHSLIGATPELLANGIPDEAFKPIEGDDKTHAASLRKRNKSERQGQASFVFGDESVRDLSAPLIRDLAELDRLPDDSISALRQKERCYSAFADSPEARRAKLTADFWCAAFVAPKRPGEPVITQEILRRVLVGQTSVSAAVRDRVKGLAEEYRFFHWQLAFAQIFHEKGGFDLVLGNPPWEQLELKEQEFFASRDPEIAEAPGVKRKQMIARLSETNPVLDREYRQALMRVDALTHFLRASGRYPLCGTGRINSYSVFAETMRSLISPTGRAGIIVPTGIVTDDTTKDFFAELVEQRGLASLYDFENAAPIFPAVHRSYKFCLLTLVGRQRPVGSPEFVFFAHRIEDLSEEKRRFQLTADDFRLLNPNTRTCPIFRTRRDFEITRRIYQRVPVLLNRSRPGGNGWRVSFRQGLFNMTGDSDLFRTRAQLEGDGWELDGNVFRRDGDTYLPLYEGKMFHQLDHRFASFEANSEARELTPLEKANSQRLALPRYWVRQRDVLGKLAENASRWLLAWRNIARTTDERTFISASLPRTAIGHSAQLLISSNNPAPLLAILNSPVLDFTVRQKLGGTNMTFFTIEQLPVPAPDALSAPAPWDGCTTIERWMSPRLAELCCTAVDMQPLAEELGFEEAPFRWSDDRRELLRAELNAACCHVYQIDRDEVAYIMDSFPIVAEKDERVHGEYRTKRLMLERYDALAIAMATGVAYTTVLDPPPAHASVAIKNTAVESLTIQAHEQ